MTKTLNTPLVNVDKTNENLGSSKKNKEMKIFLEMNFIPIMLVLTPYHFLKQFLLLM